MILAQNIMTLTVQQRAQLFAMLTQHIDIFVKVLPNVALLDRIQSDSWPASTQDALIQAYLAWRNHS
jgi:hypothetical protein